MDKLETERDQWKRCFEPLKKKLREIEESESTLRIALDKAERDTAALRQKNAELTTKAGKADADVKKSEAALKEFESKFKVCFTGYSSEPINYDSKFIINIDKNVLIFYLQKEIETLRKHNKQINEDLKIQKEYAKKSEVAFNSDMETIRRDLNRACKNSSELEVTNSELKEEVSDCF